MASWPERMQRRGQGAGHTSALRYLALLSIACFLAPHVQAQTTVGVYMKTAGTVTTAPAGFRLVTELSLLALVPPKVVA